jgi:GT2 family glycosyltransferase
MTRPSTPLVVVIPTHGRPAALAAALEATGASLRSLPQGEVVVVADGIQPAVRDVVRRAAEHGVPVRLLEQERRGPAAARNNGARSADAGVIAFVDDDCRPDPGWAQALVDAVGGRDGVLVGGGIENAASGVPAAVSHLVVEEACAWFRRAAPAHAFHPSMNLAMTRVTFELLGGFDERFPTPAAEDRDLCERATQLGLPLVVAADAVVRHDHHLDWADLWRQHNAYGRGAPHLERARAAQGRPAGRLDLRLYGALLRAALGGSHPWRTAFGIGLTQLAYAVGVLQALRRRASR